MIKKKSKKIKEKTLSAKLRLKEKKGGGQFVILLADKVAVENQ